MNRRAERIDKRLMQTGTRGNAALTVSIILAICSAYATIAQAVCLARLITGLAFRHVLPMPWLIALAALFLLRAFLIYAGEITGFQAAARIKTALRESLLAKQFALGPLRQPNSAEAATTWLEGVDALEPYFSRYLPQMALCIAVPFAILALVFPLDFFSGAILLIAGPLIPLFMVLIGYKAEAANQLQWQNLLRLGAHFLDILQGLTTLKLFGRARDEIAIARKIGEDYRRSVMQGLRIAFLSSAVLEFFASLAIALIAVLFGARLIHGHFDFFPAFLVLLLAPEFFAPLRGLATHYHARMSAIAAARQIFDFLALPVPPPAQGQLADAGAFEIACENLCFAYDGVPVLQNLSAHFPAKSLIAITGPSGAGKTTLAKLLLGFAPPASGVIAINGQNLSEISLESWWENIAWVPQSPQFFPGSIAENLRLAAPHATTEALREACWQAQALPFIEALPAQFETPLGDAGAGLSGGQLQRLALARAFLADRKILILDEPTASLDAAAEAAIIASLLSLSRFRTIIVITHRLAVARQAQLHLTLQAGQLTRGYERCAS